MIPGKFLVTVEPVSEPTSVPPGSDSYADERPDVVQTAAGRGEAYKPMTAADVQDICKRLGETMLTEPVIIGGLDHGRKLSRSERQTMCEIIVALAKSRRQLMKDRNAQVVKDAAGKAVDGFGPAMAALREEITNAILPKRNRGLYKKYNVHRVDMKDKVGGKHEKCKLFVLDLTHDPHSWPAAKAYADSCEKEFPQLAADLREEIAGVVDGHKEGVPEGFVTPTNDKLLTLEQMNKLIGVNIEAFPPGFVAGQPEAANYASAKVAENVFTPEQADKVAMHSLRDEVARLKRDAASLAHEVAGANRVIEDQQAALKQAGENETKAKQTIDGLVQEQKKLRTQVAGHEASSKQQSEYVRQLREEIEATVRAGNNIALEATELRRKIADLKAGSMALNELDQLREQVKTLTGRNELQAKAKDSLAEQLAELRGRTSGLTQERTKREEFDAAKIKRLKEEIERQRGELSRCRTTVIDYGNRLSHIREKAMLPDIDAAKPDAGRQTY